MEIVRVIFYYYTRGFTVESVNRDMTSFGAKLSGSLNRNNHQMILGIYAFIREMISERVIRDLRSSKLGGAGT